MARRAYASEDKAARRGEILAAARRLSAQAGELPSVAQVAAAAGLAKGTVYLYFRTKGAIFAAVLLDGWSAVVGRLEAAFGAPEAAPAERVAVFLRSFVDYLAGNPALLRLDAVVQGLLTSDLDADELAAFKLALHGRIGAGGAVVDAALGLPPGRGVQLLVRTHALTRGLWAYFDASGAGGGADLSGFAGELTQALGEYWRGALAEPSDPTPAQASRMEPHP